MDPKGILEAIKKFLALLGIKTDEPADGDDPAKKGTAAGEGTVPAAGESGSKTDSAELEALRNQVKQQQAKIDALEAVSRKQKDAQVKADADARIDEAVKNRISLIDTAKSIIPDFKYDGLSDRAIKLAVIEKTLPYEKTTKVDELETVFIDARFDAALTLAKEKANITGDVTPEGRIDEAAIEKKKADRLNVMEV